MNIPPILVLTPVFMRLAGCPGVATPYAQDPSPIAYTLDPLTRYQTVHHFGASDAWTVQFVGENWPLDQRTRIADLLFSTEVDSGGNPLGIGLSAWRFNIGAGSAEQGADSQITDEWRRSETFLNADGSYDWFKQQGQQWFLREAQVRGVTDFVGFVNSPPVYLTRNGRAWSQDGTSANLAAEHYRAYADYLVEVTRGVQAATGVTFDYDSPFNEPQWEWKCCNQEGSPWNNNELAAATRVIDAAFREAGIEGTRLELPEAGQIEFLYSDSQEPGNRNDQIADFFLPSSPHYLGDMDYVAHKVAGHSYFSTWDVQHLQEVRGELRQKIQSVDPTLEYGVSKYALLEDNPEIKGIDPALYVARVIQADLTLAWASAWHWWLAVSPYDYKDGLVYIDRDKDGGAVYDSKMLWALGNFSRFIRPGGLPRPS